MSLRDLGAALVGASLSLVVALVTYSGHPEQILKSLLWVCLGLLGLVLVIQALRSPWLTADIQGAFIREDGRLVVQLSLVVHGKGSLGHQIVNLFVPQSLPFERCNHDGSTRAEVRPLRNVSATLGTEASKNWNAERMFPRGRYQYFFAIDPWKRETVPFRLNILDKPRDAILPMSALDKPVAFDYSPMRVWCVHTLDRIRGWFLRAPGRMWRWLPWRR